MDNSLSAMQAINGYILGFRHCEDTHWIAKRLCANEIVITRLSRKSIPAMAPAW
jgi:hypothetical protein